MVKESLEEASIEPRYVRGFARGAGALSFFYRFVMCFDFRLSSLRFVLFVFVFGDFGMRLMIGFFFFFLGLIKDGCSRR